MKKYSMIFFAIYALFAVVATLLAIASSKGLTFHLALLCGASFAAGWVFFKDYERVPAAEERHQYSRQALLALWLLALVLAFPVIRFVLRMELTVFFTLLHAPSLLLMLIGGSLLFSLIYYWLLHWSFGWYGSYATKPQ